MRLDIAVCVQLDGFGVEVRPQTDERTSEGHTYGDIYRQGYEETYELE